MSTVDAAIINHITNGGSSSCGGGSTGVVYTAGDGISLTNNKIVVKYNTSTMEIVNGALSAKISGSSGGGSSGGGSSEGEILHYISGLETLPSTQNYIDYRGFPEQTVMTGLRLRLYNNTEARDEDYVLIMRKYEFPTEGNITDVNAMFVPLNYHNSIYHSIPVHTYNDADKTYAIRIHVELGKYIYKDEETGKYGMFTAQQHTLQTLTTIQQADIMFRLMPHLDLIKYFETTIETLKDKVGI